MASGSFSREQIAYFREVFSDAEAAGLGREAFCSAIGRCQERMDLTSTPPPEFLAGEYARLSRMSGTGLVTWQQFFQILIHINASHSGVEDESSSQPQEVEVVVVEEEEGNGRGGEVVVVTGGEDMMDDVFGDAVFEVEEPPPQPSFSQTLVRGGASLGRAVANFFGLTDESIHGTAYQAGWRQVSERRAEEGDLGFLTLSRSASLRRAVPDEPPPDYAGLAGARSFNPDELSDDSEEEEEDTFVSAAPPSYDDAIAPGVSQAGLGVAAVTQASVYGQGTGPAPTAAPQQYPPPTHPQPSRMQAQPAASSSLRREELIYDKSQAYEYYLKFIKAEKRLRHRRHHDEAFEFFGREGGGGQQGSAPQVQTEEEGPEGVVRRRKKKRKTKLQRQSTLVRHKVESLPSFWPVFIILLSIAQVAGMIVILAIRGLAPIKAEPVESTAIFPSLSNETTNASVTYYRAANLWIGPSPSDLIEVGARFTPCMRSDFGIRLRISGTLENSTLGCCKNMQWQGTTVSSDCVTNGTSNVPGGPTDYSVGVVCSEANSTLFRPDSNLNFHPCCVSITGHCLVTSEQECSARGGWFHMDADNCREVNCLRSVCGFNGAQVSEQDGAVVLPAANQFWRWFLSIFIHLGVIHMLVLMPIQLYVGIKIERTIGWLRIGIIYLISGVGGNLVSAIFVPYEVNAGASGAVLGLLGVLFVELLTFWRIVDRAYLELLKLSAFVLFLFALGTLPYVDNWAHLGGFIFGLVSAVIFVPYITFGKWDACWKRLLLVICIPLLLFLFVAGFVTFYLLGVLTTPGFCPGCQYFNCIPYSANFCPEEYNTADPSTFSL